MAKIKTVIWYEQHIPAWNKFFINDKTKEELINITVKFLKSNKGRELINSPYIVTAGDKIYRFQVGQGKVNERNHDEADSVKLLTITHELYTKMFCDQKFQVSSCVSN